MRERRGLWERSNTPDAPAGAAPGRGAKLLLLLVSTVVTLGMVEVALRLFTPPPPPPESTLRTFTEHDPELGWRGVPDARGTFQTHDFAIDVALNEGGWRDDAPGSAGGRTIILLGDSYSWGYGVERGEMFADLLEDLLPATDVRNFGISGFATDQELLVLRKHGLLLHPDAVIVQITLANDLSHIVKKKAYHLPKPRFVLSGDSLALEGVPVPAVENWDQIQRLGGARSFLESHVRLYSWVRPRWSQLTTTLGEALGDDEMTEPRRMKPFRRQPDGKTEKAWKLMEALLREIRREADSVGCPVVLLAVPDPLQVDDIMWEWALENFALDPGAYDQETPNRRLQEIAGRLELPVADPRGTLRDCLEAGCDPFLTAEDPHWNLEGNRRVAALLAGVISALPEHAP